jgi:peptidyl-tRNA hydrolase
MNVAVVEKALAMIRSALANQVMDATSSIFYRDSDFLWQTF